MIIYYINFNIKQGFLGPIKFLSRSHYFKNGTPERSRTPNLLIRSQALYPIELRVHCKISYKDKPFKEFKQNF